MKQTKILLLFLLLALFLTACRGEILCKVCGKPALNHVCCPAAPCPVCGATYLCDCAVVETVMTQDPCPICGATVLCNCLQGSPLVGEPSPMRAEESHCVWLERPLMYDNSGLVRTLELTKIPPSGINPADGEQMYTMAGVGTVKFSELPAQFTFKWDERIEIAGIIVHRFPLYDHTSGEICELTENKLILEAGYYYEFILLTPTGTETYGILTAAEIPRDAFATPTNEIRAGYTYLGDKKQTKITQSMYEARWNAEDPSSNMVAQTASSPPYQLPELCEISATAPTVRLIANSEVAAYVISATPVDENNKFISGTGKGKTFTLEDDTFELLEGSFYYGVYVCFDGGSFVNYGFVAHYDPNLTKDDAIAALPILTDAPPLKLTRPLTREVDVVHVLYPFTMIHADRPTAPFYFEGKAVYANEAGAEFTIVPDSSLQVKNIIVRYYPDEKMDEWQYYDMSGGTIRLEKDYRYEIDVICENGRAIYGISCLNTTMPSIGDSDIHIHYDSAGKIRMQTIHNSLYSVSWEEINGMSEAQATSVIHPSKNLDALPQIHPTDSEAYLTANSKHILTYAAVAIPLDETGALVKGSDRIMLEVNRIPLSSDYPQSFTLLEGSYYYEIYYCANRTTYTIYAFIAHYTPQKGE